VIAEHTVKSFDKFFNLMAPQDKVKVLSFVKKHSGNSRVSLRKEAERFLKRHTESGQFSETLIRKFPK
jgi:hypothetical protein